MTFKPTSSASRNNSSRFSRWYLPSSSSATFHSTQVRTVLKPSCFIFDRSSFQSLGESAVMVSSMGARTLPPLYHTATGKNVVSRPLLWLVSECVSLRSSRIPVMCTETPVEADTDLQRDGGANEGGCLTKIR